nr:MAG TPA: hypothetical protein [Caudoviricetes sp.]
MLLWALICPLNLSFIICSFLHNGHLNGALSLLIMLK